MQGFIKLHEAHWPNTKSPATRGTAFFVNPQFISLIERSDIAMHVEGAGVDRAHLYFHAFERAGTGVMQSIGRNCFESTSEVMEKIAIAERG